MRERMIKFLVIFSIAFGGFWLGYSCRNFEYKAGFADGQVAWRKYEDDCARAAAKAAIIKSEPKKNEGEE